MKVLLNFHCSALYCISIIPSIKVFAELFLKSDRTPSNKFRCALNVGCAEQIKFSWIFHKNALRCIAIAPSNKVFCGAFFKKRPSPYQAKFALLKYGRFTSYSYHSSNKVFAELFSKSDRLPIKQISDCLNMIALHRIAITPSIKIFEGIPKGNFF